MNEKRMIDGGMKYKRWNDGGMKENRLNDGGMILERQKREYIEETEWWRGEHRVV